MMKKLLWNGFIKKNCHLNFQTLSALNSFQGLFVFSCPAVVPQLFIAFLQLSIERKNYFLILSSLADIKQITIPIHLQAAHVRNAHKQHERCSFISFLYFRSFVKGLTIEVMLMNQLQFYLNSNLIAFLLSLFISTIDHAPCSSSWFQLFWIRNMKPWTFSLEKIFIRSEDSL